METRELPEAGGAPTITAVTDLGGRDIPLSGEVRPEGASDGVAVIGEGLWIRGRSFGRQPTVTVGGRPARVWSRTGDGGLLVRVPVGAAAGPSAVVVRQEYGAAEASLPVRRYAGVLAAGRVTWLDAGGEEPAAAGQAEAPGARFLRISPDGRAAYALGPTSLAAFELTAPGQPRALSPVSLPGGPLVAFTGGAAVNLLAVVREADVTFVELRSPLRPQPAPPVPLPPSVRRGRVVGAELSPDGTFLAFALAEGNRVLLADRARLATSGGDNAIIGDVALASESRAPVIVDLAFAPDGRTLWVLAGDTESSRAFGPQPTRVFALRVNPDAGTHLSLARSVTVDAAAPVRLATGRGLPLGSGATVRLPPEKATVYFTAAQPQAAAGAGAVYSIGAQDTATRIAGAEGRASGLDVMPDGRRLLAASPRQAIWAPADGRAGAVRTLTLPGGGAIPAPVEVRIQP